MDDTFERLASDLEGLLEGSVTEDQFRSRRHMSANETGVIESLLANLDHYLADADIRSKDSAYREMRDGELKTLISALRSGRIGDALKVNFLGPSRRLRS
jgi:hypothetical protein